VGWQEKFINVIESVLILEIIGEFFYFQICKNYGGEFFEKLGVIGI